MRVGKGGLYRFWTEQISPSQIQGHLGLRPQQTYSPERPGHQISLAVYTVPFFFLAALKTTVYTCICLAGDFPEPTFNERRKLQCIHVCMQYSHVPTCGIQAGTRALHGIASAHCPKLHAAVIILLKRRPSNLPAAKKHAHSPFLRLFIIKHKPTKPVTHGGDTLGPISRPRSERVTGSERVISCDEEANQHSLLPHVFHQLEYIPSPRWLLSRSDALTDIKSRNWIIR